VSDTDSPAPAARSRFAHGAKMVLLAALLAWLSLVFWNSAKPLPPGTHIASQTSRLSESDVDFVSGYSQYEAVPAREMSAIDHAEQLIVLDRSPVSGELSQHLLARKRLRPNLQIVRVTDPGNEAFGGTPSRTLTSLEQAGVIVARVRLDRLRDSNPLYSGLWRLIFGWWSDPFDETSDETSDRISLPAWARMQNFKADQRQLVIADDGSGGWSAIVGAAGASSGLILRGSLARAMIAGELEIAGWSTDDDRLPVGPPVDGRAVGSIDARFLTEGSIESALLDAIGAAGGGDELSIAVQNFSDRRLIGATLVAAARGARLRVLMTRNQIPNQAVAGELLRGGGGRIEVRWCRIDAEARLPRLLVLHHRNDLWVNLGSANFTRRNLGDLNLESSVELRMPAHAAPGRAVTDYFAKIWSDAAVAADFADESPMAYWRYRIAEATGLSTF
jgi:hypothetical protein